MAKRKFIIQGFTASTHAYAVRELLNTANFTNIILSVAFVKESGVQQIESELKARAKDVVVFAGVRNDITSYQGLKLLHSIIGSNLYTVDTGSRNIVYHPKLYLARGMLEARVIVGSANLTLGGLNNNIEASAILEFDLTDSDDKALVDDTEAQLTALPKSYPLNVVQVSSVSELDDLPANGRVVDEGASSAPRPVASTRTTGAGDIVPLIKLKRMPVRSGIPKLGRVTKRKKSPKAATPATTVSTAPAHGLATVGTEFELVWQSKPLTRRDLNIPDERHTHATGSMNLDKGLLPESVDHRHYFRDEVFDALTWSRRSATVDETSARFQLIVKGVNHGEFDLSIRHTTSTTSAAYRQRNAMTRLSWGPMTQHVAWPDLIDRTLSLYRDKVDPTRFILEID
jgi:HKD family nuclease